MIVGEKLLMLHSGSDGMQYCSSNALTNITYFKPTFEPYSSKNKTNFISKWPAFVLFFEDQGSKSRFKVHYIGTYLLKYIPSPPPPLCSARGVSPTTNMPFGSSCCMCGSSSVALVAAGSSATSGSALTSVIVVAATTTNRSSLCSTISSAALSKGRVQ